MMTNQEKTVSRRNTVNDRNGLQGRKAALKDLSPLNVSERHTPSATNMQMRGQAFNANRLFGTTNSVQDAHEGQSNLSLSFINNQNLYSRQLNDNFSDQLLHDSNQLRQQKAQLEKDNALLLQKTDHQNQEIQMLKDKILAQKVEQDQLIKVIQSSSDKLPDPSQIKYVEE